MFNCFNWQLTQMKRIRMNEQMESIRKSPSKMNNNNNTKKKRRGKNTFEINHFFRFKFSIFMIFFSFLLINMFRSAFCLLHFRPQQRTGCRSQRVFCFPENVSGCFNNYKQWNSIEFESEKWNIWIPITTSKPFLLV